jgi:hypothetical protein
MEKNHLSARIKRFSNIATKSFSLRCSISRPLHFSTRTPKTSQLFSWNYSSKLNSHTVHFSRTERNGTSILYSFAKCFSFSPRTTRRTVLPTGRKFGRIFSNILKKNVSTQKMCCRIFPTKTVQSFLFGNLVRYKFCNQY